MIDRKSITWKRFLLWFIVTAVLIASIIAIIVLNKKISDSEKFQEKVITSKFEGSLSENLGFLTMLTTEITRIKEVKNKIRDKEKNKIIRKHLKDLRGNIINGRKLAVSEPSSIEKDSNIEKTSINELASWLHPETLKQINYRHLNLESSEIDFTCAQYLHSTSSPAGQPLKSFVLVPAQLMSYKNNVPVLSTSVKKEIIFSKIIEGKVEDIFSPELKDLEVWQAYFIPLSGMVRITNKENKGNLYNFYKDILPGNSCYSDRPYFKKSITEPYEVHQSNPYIDSAGKGLIVSFTIAIEHKELGIIGMIGVDRKIGDFSDILSKVKLGADVGPKGFHMFTYRLGKNNNKSQILEYYDHHSAQYQYISKTIDEVEKNQNKLFQTDIIVRRDFDDDNTVYMVKLGVGKERCDEVAFFHFSPDFIKRKNSILVIFYGLSLLGIFIPLLLAGNFFFSRLKVQKLQTEFYSHVNGGLIIGDEEGKIIVSNKKMADLVNTPQIINKNFLSDFMTDESRADYIDLLQKSPDGFEFSGRIKRSARGSFPAIISNAAINYPGIARARMSIIIPSEQLERTIAAEFIHGFSHALKTPVQSIILLADRLRRKKLPPQQSDRYYVLMRREVDEFTNMVTNLLKFSKLEIEETRLNKETTNIGHLLRSVIKPFKAKAALKDIQIKENIPERMSAEVDKEIFRVILTNLLENAQKYSDEGAIITVKANETPKSVEISICDTGVGIPEDEKDKIFEKFFRGGGHDIRAKDGIGIGLYVSKKYIDHHGGTLTYEPNIQKEINRKGRTITTKKGSKFTIHLPKK